MNFNFDEKINNFLKIIAKNAQAQNKRVFFVGGIVRDNILNVDTFDIDILFEGNAIEFAKSLNDDIEIKSIHQDFCTVKVIYQNLEIDIASSRTEKYPYSGCLPVLDEVGVTIEKDVLRRDFSVNSLYAQILLKDDELSFELVDLVGGIDDIKSKTLRVLHNRSYIDDPTRILRGVGFKYRFDFDFSKNDINLIQNYLSNIDYSNMSIDRVEKVLKKLFELEQQDDIFNYIAINNLHSIFNSSSVNIDCSLISKIISDFNLNLYQKAELYMQILSNPQVIMRYYCDILDSYKGFKKFDLSNLAYYYYKTLDKNVLEYLKVKDVKLKISGDDLIGRGVEQGKQIGEILDYILKEKLNNPNQYLTKNDELKLIQNRFPHLKKI